MLHKFAWEVEELPVEEFDMWIAWIQLKQEAEDKARKESEQKMRAAQSSRRRPR